jgi:lipoprotein NlpI
MPDNQATWNEQALRFYQDEHFDEALAAFDYALALDESLGFIWRNKSRALRALGRDAEAQEAERQADSC